MSENENDESPQEQGPLTRRGIKITAMPKGNGLLHVSGLWSRKQKNGDEFFGSPNLFVGNLRYRCCQKLNQT